MFNQHVQTPPPNPSRVEAKLPGLLPLHRAQRCLRTRGRGRSIPHGSPRRVQEGGSLAVVTRVGGAPLPDAELHRAEQILFTRAWSFAEPFSRHKAIKKLEF